MTAILNRSRLWRLAGVLALTVALAAIPVGAVSAADNSQGATISLEPTLRPLPVTHARNRYRYVQDGQSEVVINWDDPSDRTNPLCYGMSGVCFAYAFAGYWAAFINPSVTFSMGDIDAARYYVVENRQRPRASVNNKQISGWHDWQEIGRVSADRDELSFEVRSAEDPTPVRVSDYRVKACNNVGCSAWSYTYATIKYPWCNEHNYGTRSDCS